MMKKPVRALAAVAAGFVLCAGLPAANASTPLVLTYSIREARAYALKVSLSKQELQLIPPCDPKKDPYGCDTSKYVHTPNCPATIALGRTKPGPLPEPASKMIVVSGGSASGLGMEPNQSSPVRLNKLIALGRLGHSGMFPSAGGFASDQYVDLNGRQTPEAHTQSEAFSNLPDYEERCWPAPVNTSSFQHFLSRSGDGPTTYHLAECFGSECTLGAGISVEHALSLVDLHEKGGDVIGTAQSELQGLDLIPGVAKIDLLATYISIHSDGTGKGLVWSVATTVAGLTVAGQKVAIPVGATIPLQGGLTIGIVPPYVLPADGGHNVSIMAPGLAVMSDEQSIFLGGAELYGTFDREPASSFNPFHPLIVPPPALPSILPQPALQIPTVTPGAQPVAAPQFAIRMYDTGQVAIAVILASGFAALMLILLRWSRRWAWGRRLCCVQPFAGIDWLYRAFIKT